MDIKITENLSIEPYAHGWMLHKSEDKVHESGKYKGKGYVSIKTRYYSNLHQLCNAAIDDQLKGCESMEEIRTLLIDAREGLM